MGTQPHITVSLANQAGQVCPPSSAAGVHPAGASGLNRWVVSSPRAPVAAPVASLSRIAASAELLNRIQYLWAGGQGQTLKLAIEVCDARRKLPHGEWTALFRRDRRVSERMPFSQRQADRLIGIARLVWLNETGLSRLPRSWSSLCLLAKLDRPVLERLIREGFLHPALSLQEVRQLVARFSGQLSRDHSGEVGARKRVQRFCRFVLDGWAHWSARQRQWTSNELLQLLRQVRQLEGGNGSDHSHPNREEAPRE